MVIEMAGRCVGIVVSGEVVTVVDGEIPDAPDEPITIITDATWSLQKGERASAYAVLHQRCADYIRENKIDSVVVKASAMPAKAAKGLLPSAEVRGVVIAAAASVCNVNVVSKAVISRTFGDRKVDDYIKDDTFWDEHTVGGKLRKRSREAALLMIAERDT